MKIKRISVLIAGMLMTVSMLGATACGGSKGSTSSTPDTPTEPEHVHNKSEWKSDETCHWHTCDGCDEILDKADHTFGEWVETKAATCTEKGEKTKTCTVCKYVVTEEIPMLGHTTKETRDADDTYHWYTCETCGEQLEKAEHTFGDWQIIEEPTCSKVGKKSKTCSVCEHVIEEEIPIDPEKHELGSYEITKEPTKDTEGTILLKCKHNTEHTQEVKLPALATRVYQRLKDDKNENYYDTYYRFNPNNKEEVERLFAGTWLEGTDQLTSLISDRTFGHKDVCKHIAFTAEYLTTPTNSSAGKIKVTCANCGESETVSIAVSSLKNYTCVPSETEVGQAKYNLNLTASGELYENSNLKTKFPENKIDIVKTIKNVAFDAPLYDLHIEKVYSMDDGTCPVALKVFIPRDITLPQYVEVNTHIVYLQDEWLRYEYKSGVNCTEPVTKSIYIREDKALELAQKYLDPECGVVSTHPNIVSELTSICFASKMSVTPDEQKEHSRHTLGSLQLWDQPLGREGEIRVFCSNRSKCKYFYKLKVPNYNDTTFYDVQETDARAFYKVKDSSIDTIIYNELKDKFIFTLDDAFRQKFRNILDCTVSKGVALVTSRHISDTSDTFAFEIHIGGEYYTTIEGNITRNETQYFNFRYQDTACDDFKTWYLLNEAGAKKVLSSLSEDLQQNIYMKRNLVGLRVGIVTPPAAEISANKTHHHQFVYFSHELPRGTTERNGHVWVRCPDCSTLFKVSISNNDIYTSDGGQQVVNQQGLENRIKEVYPEFTPVEVRTYAEIFINGGYI